MNAGTEEYTWRTVQLRNDNTFGTVDDKRTIVRHVRNRAQEHILNNCVEILMVGVGTEKFQFGLKGYTVGQATFQTLLD